MTTSAEYLAERFHESCVRLGPDHGYGAKEAPRKSWTDASDKYKGLMVAVCQELIDRNVFVLMD